MGGPRVKLFIAVVVVGAVAAGCSTSGTQLPLTRAADADSLAGTRTGTGTGPGGPARTTVSLGPLDQQLAPDVLVRLPSPLDTGMGQKLAGLVSAGRSTTLRTGPLPIAAPAGTGTVSAAGVDPRVFRR